jgi:glycerol kinase
MEIEHSLNRETTALGAAFMAGLATGFWNSMEDLKRIRQVDKVYSPQMNALEREKRYMIWKDIIKRSLNFHDM